MFLGFGRDPSPRQAPRRRARVALPGDHAKQSMTQSPQKMQADLAWGIWQPQAQVVIAIVDTGIDVTHPDLTNKIYRNGAGAVSLS